MTTTATPPAPAPAAPPPAADSSIDLKKLAVNWGGLGAAIGVLLGVVGTSFAYGRADAARDARIERTERVLSAIERAEPDKRLALLEQRLGSIEGGVARQEQKMDAIMTRLGVPQPK